MISEVVPAPKVFMFFALFNTVGKTSGFIGTSNLLRPLNPADIASQAPLFPAQSSTGRAVIITPRSTSSSHWV